MLHMFSHGLPRRVILAGVDVSWKKSRGGQTKAWHQFTRTLVTDLNHAGRCRLPDWAMHNNYDQLLGMLDDIA